MHLLQMGRLVCLVGPAHMGACVLHNRICLQTHSKSLVLQKASPMEGLQTGQRRCSATWPRHNPASPRPPSRWSPR